MLDVVLYRRDRRGRLHLEELTFTSLERLALYIASEAGRGWEWAEVTPIVRCCPDRVGRTVRYSARALLEMARRPPVV